MCASRRDDHTIDIFGGASDAQSGDDRGWPPSIRFPVNTNKLHVQDVVWDDLQDSRQPLIVTGYAGLDKVIDLVSEADNCEQIQLLFGNEPHTSRREHYHLSETAFTQEVEDYWLQRGISLLRSAALIHTVEQLKSGRVQARYMPGGRMLHAKIYLGDAAGTVGSSNFTRPGLEGQFEANARFDKKQDRQRYHELRQIAQNYWAMGRNYNEELIALLERLLKVVDWDEALARACAEMLEGDWAQAYLQDEYLSEAGSLWPSQKQGIAQALLVLSNQGSVLIADATGAGKTRMGTYLIGAVRDHIVRKGRIRQGKALMICPPSVEENWMRESTLAAVPLDIYSHGKLSHTRSRRHDLGVEALRRAQILCVDEGHNFLNSKSTRTQQVLRNMADHVVLLTATPINKGVIDLLRIADMLGADNLEESTFKAFQKMLGVKSISRSLTEDEIAVLRKEINKFTVRRTKKVLNTLIDREPGLYRDKDGNTCRFPKHAAKFYKLFESEQDCALAAEIREQANHLHGVTHFVKAVEMPEVLRKQGTTEERYLAGRLNAASKLARYMIMSALRSSRAALIEHALGTERAIAEFQIKGFSKKTGGNIYHQIKKIQGQPPQNKLSISLPDWLTEPEKHRQACEHDMTTYQRIAELALQMSDHREKTKAQLLLRLVHEHSLLLAFDSRPISLAYFRKLLKGHSKTETLLAWGDASSDRETLLKDFAHGSTRKGVIGLCSDSLAEGVNLQQASVLVHLDMPTVVRVAEQRVGRVDRLDSPHRRIEAWWPEDAAEFALSSDDRFIERYDTVDQLLGSNMPLPEHLQSSETSKVSAQQIISELEQTEAQPWDGIDDAFAPVRSLVGGPQALVSDETYENYRTVNSRVLSRVGLVRAKSPWAFFCISSGSFGAPRWIFMPNAMGTPLVELADVSMALRERLLPETENLELDESSALVLNRFISRLSIVERMLLPRKKQRALDEMEGLVSHLLRYSANEENQSWIDHLREIEKMLKYPMPDRQPDWDEVASRWLDVIRPVWFERLNAPGRTKPLLLKDIRKDLKKKEVWLIGQLEMHFRKFPVLANTEERIRACIIGVT